MAIIAEGWVAKLVERLLVKASFIGSNPDIPQKP
jgi:hypothetical protein